MKSTATQYIVNNNWWVFPCKGKIPATPHGFKDAINDALEVNNLFKDNHNIGIATGKISGIFVLDIDVKDGAKGAESLKQLVSQHGSIPHTVEARTWSGGTHYFFKYPESPVGCRTNIMPGIDSRGDGGYVVAPPSVIKDCSYEWIHSPETTMLAEAPKWLIEFVSAPSHTGDIDLSHEEAKISANRNDTLMLMGVKLRKMGMGGPEIEMTLQGINQRRCQPPLPKKEISTIAASVSRYSRADVTKPLTDVFNADIMYQRCGDDIKYCDALGGWYIWDDTRWQRDDNFHIMRKAKQTVKQMFQMSEASNDKKLYAHAVKSEASQKLKSMIELVKSEPGITVPAETFDTDYYYINCKNGTLDMVTGELMPHNRDHMITKSIEYEYDKTQKCPTWIQFLKTVFLNDEKLINYIHKAVGYSMSGNMSEQCIFILYGTGQNGKSTFLKHLFKIFGDYAMNTPASTLIEKYNEGIPNDIARLKGARFVTSIESGKHKKFAEAQIKQLTGDDPISARFLHKEFFDFFSTFKIFFATNHKPQISGTDLGIWRRIRTIPFEKTFTAMEIDKTIDKKIESEYEGILAWAVEGFRKWQEEGLGNVQRIVDATEEYRTESDVMGDYINENCHTGEGFKVKSSSLITDCQEWAHNNGLKNISRHEILDYLKNSGYEKKRSGGYPYWYGIGLRAEEAYETDERPY